MYLLLKCKRYPVFTVLITPPVMQIIEMTNRQVLQYFFPHIFLPQLNQKPTKSNLLKNHVTQGISRAVRRTHWVNGKTTVEVIYTFETLRLGLMGISWHIGAFFKDIFSAKWLYFIQYYTMYYTTIIQTQ